MPLCHRYKVDPEANNPILTLNPIGQENVYDIMA